MSKSNANESRSYKRNGVGVTAPVLSDGVSTMVPGIAEKTNGGVSTILTDRLGSMKALSGGGGVTDTVEYDAFGNAFGRTGTTPTQKGFASGHGYQEDGESGYKLLGHRYYDPETGRFLSRDPAFAGRNWYGYARNNPLKLIDPTGLSEMLNPATAAFGAACLADAAGMDEADGDPIGKELQAQGGMFTDWLTNLLQSLASEAQSIANESGPVSGTIKHGLANEGLVNSGIGAQTEQSFLNGQLVPYGTAGSIRVDAILPQENYIVDWKFGSAILTDARIQQIRDNLPEALKGHDIVGISPWKSIREKSLRRSFLKPESSGRMSDISR